MFKVNTDGTDFVNLHTFTAFDGSGPKGALVLSGGILYGTASSGGNGLAGTVFQINTDGMGFSTLHTFLFQQGTPVGDLVAIGNTVYGTSEYGEFPRFGICVRGDADWHAVHRVYRHAVQWTAAVERGIHGSGHGRQRQSDRPISLGFR